MKFDAQSPRAGALKPLQLRAPDIEAYLLAKDPRASGAWDQIGSDEHIRAFTAAQTAGTDIADDLYFGLVDVVSRSGSQADFAKLVTPILKSKGWLEGDDGKIATRVALIYQTNIDRAREAGKWAKYQAAKSALPYLRGTSAHDNRVRRPPKSPDSDHRAWDGIILPVDHAFWQRWGVGHIGFRCRCDTVQMSRSMLARYKGGITSEAELADREARLGRPIFASPAAPMLAQVQGMVSASNDPAPRDDGSAGRMPGLPALQPADMMRGGADLWRQVAAEKIVGEVADALAKLFGF